MPQNLDEPALRGRATQALPESRAHKMQRGPSRKRRSVRPGQGWPSRSALGDQVRLPGTSLHLIF